MNKFIKNIDNLLELIINRIKNTYIYTIFVSVCLDNIFDYLDNLGELEYTLSFGETFYATCVLFIIGCILYTLINSFYQNIKTKYKNYIEN